MNELVKQDQPEQLPARTVITPLEMLNEAMHKGVDAETLQKFMDLHERWQRDQSRIAFHRAVAAFKAAPPDVVKDMVNKQYNSNYTSLAKLVNTVNSALAQHALTARWTHAQDPNGMISVTCILSHSSGHSEEVTLVGPPDDSGAKNTLQKIKSTLTYLKGATFEAVTGIASREANTDDDGNSSGEKDKPAKIGPKRMRKIVDGMLKAVELEDGPGLLQIVDELENEEQLVVWSELRSWERSAIKALVNQARAAAGQTADPNYIAPAPDPEFAKQYDEASKA